MTLSNLLLFSLGLNFAGVGLCINELHFLGILALTTSFISGLYLCNNFSFKFWVTLFFLIIISFIFNNDISEEILCLIAGINNALLFQSTNYLENNDSKRFTKISATIILSMITSLIIIFIIATCVFNTGISYMVFVAKISFSFLFPFFYSIKQSNNLRNANQML